MYVDRLALSDFRNYNKLDIGFSRGINILYGDNAQGKTNVLEAIFMAATTKSHKGSRDKEIIRFGCDEAHVRVKLKKHDVGHRIDMHIRKNKNKGVAIDGISIRRSAEIFGLINVVIFSPEDLNIIKNSPVERRRFMDMELCQLNRIYYDDLSNYNKIVRQRNNLLKQISFNRSLIDTLDVWDEQLTDYGIKIIKERNNFINMMNEIIGDIHMGLSQGKERLCLRYNKCVNEGEFLKTLQKNRESDLKYQTTQTGPHRDDIDFIINDVDAKAFGSQGQQRTATLSLKLAEIELVKKKINDNPILLLDDVMSELDKNRRDALTASIRDIQTIITCTGYDDFIKERLKIDNIYRVVNGQIDSNMV